MTGLGKLSVITDDIVKTIRRTDPSQTIEQAVMEALKRHIVEISQSCSFSKNQIPKEAKEASDFRRCARGSALHKLSVEGLNEVVSVENRSEEDEEVIIYRIFAIKP